MIFKAHRPQSQDHTSRIDRPLFLVTLVILGGFLMLPPRDGEAASSSKKAQGDRPFYLSFTYQPHDWSEKAFADTYAFIANNGDMIFHYFDDGVPWPEALAEDNFHAHVESTLRLRRDALRPGQAVSIGVNVLAKDRKSLAAYWGQDDGMPRPGEWAIRSFQDSAVITAYTKYCQRLIAFFQPNYFIYGMEVNSGITDIKSPEFSSLKSMLSHVYKNLKSNHPDLPLVLSFELGPDNGTPFTDDVVSALLPYTDVFAVSTYPYLFDGIGGDSRQLPKTFFSRVRSLIGKKPFAIAETGFNAKTWRILRRLIWIPGSEDSQARYVRFLLEEADKLEAMFVNWWVPVDLDALWEKMKMSGADPMLSQWNSNGLQDSQGQARPGLKIWKSWMEKPRREANRP